MRMGVPRRVGLGDLGERLVEDGDVVGGDVVGGGVGTSVAGPENSGQGFAGVVQEAQQRVVAEAALVGRHCLLLLEVGRDQGGVEDQDRPGRSRPPARAAGISDVVSAALQPGDIPGGGSGRVPARKCSRIDAGQQAPGGRRGGDRAENLGLVAQQGQVRYRLVAVGERDRGIYRDPAWVVLGATRSQWTQCVREGAGKLVTSERSASRRDPAWLATPVVIGRRDELGTRPGREHAESAFLLR